MPAAPGSAALVTVTVLDTPVFGDIDGDGSADAAVILVNQTGGSGTFYYLAAAINGKDGTKGTNAVLLGDRIIVRTVRIQNCVISVELSDRGASQPMAVSPTLDVTRYAVLEGDSLLLKLPGDRLADRLVADSSSDCRFTPLKLQSRDVTTSPT